MNRINSECWVPAFGVTTDGPENVSLLLFEVSYMLSQHLFIKNSTLISATELSSRQQRATTSTLILTRSHSNPSLLGACYEGSKSPRKSEQNQEITDERASKVCFSFQRLLLISFLVFIGGTRILTRQREALFEVRKAAALKRSPAAD